MFVKVFNKSGNPLPKYQTPLAAGMDLYSAINTTLQPGEVKIIPTGLFIELPEGDENVVYEGQVRPRSGLAAKYGVTVCNSPGCVDADYRGEVGVILINHGSNDFVVNNGDRIAQLIFNRVERFEWKEVDSLDDLSSTERGSGGFGHSGK